MSATLDDWIADIYRQWSERNDCEMYMFADERHRETDAMRFAVMCLTSPDYRDVLDRINGHATERALRETRPQKLEDLAIPDLTDEERDTFAAAIGLSSPGASERSGDHDEER